MSKRLSKPRAKKTAGVAHRVGRFTRRKRSGSGVVRFYVEGSLEKVTRTDFNAANLVKVLEVGLPVTELADLQATLALPAEKLAPMLGISKATFHRRKGAGRKLNPAVSDRVVRFAPLLGKAVKVFGGLEDAKQWLNSRQFGLGGSVPLD